MISIDKRSASRRSGIYFYGFPKQHSKRKSASRLLMDVMDFEEVMFERRKF